MVRGKVKENNRVSFFYSKCDGAFQHYNEVDKAWFDAHNTEDMTEEQMEKLAYADRENSHADGKTTCWGLG